MTDKHERPFSPDGLPLIHRTGVWYGGHVQGIAADTEKKFMYYSYTTDFCKYGFDGELAGSVGGFIGHIGCMCFDPERRKVYASLEYKNDEIGKGLHNRIGTGEVKDGFYIVIFNVDEINETGLSSEDCGAVNAAYLCEVVNDYHADGLCGPHKYGCSGIDGVTLMPLPGCRDGKKYLAVAYGIYGDVNRTDNDNQVILFYDTDEIEKCARPLTQSAPHTSGPLCRFRTFLYTGNTTYGVQNLEYDPYTGNTFVCVYPGKKQQYENYYLFVIDGRKPAVLTDVKGTGEVGLNLSLLPGQSSYFPYGSTGVASLSDGRFYISEPSRTQNGGNTTEVVMYSYSEETGFTRLINKEIL